jgi:hypothetical protein
MIINQTAGPTDITINNNNLKQVEKYKYLGSILNDKLDYDKQWEKTANCHIYLIKQLKRMGFKEEILMNIYRSITFSQYLYNASILGSASTQAKKEIEKQQHGFFNIIGIRSATALETYKIEPIATFLDHQCVNVVERILKDPTHPITQKQTVKSHHNTRSSQHIPETARTKTYQNSCLQKAI